MVVNPIGCFSRVFWNKRDIHSLNLRSVQRGCNRLSDFLLRLSILLTSEGTLLSDGCRGRKSSSGCGSTYVLKIFLLKNGLKHNIFHFDGLDKLFPIKVTISDFEKLVKLLYQRFVGKSICGLPEFIQFYTYIHAT